MHQLTDRVAVVTGGARGIGQAIALELARAGALVAVADIDIEGATSVAAEITDGGGRATAVDLDVGADEDTIRAGVELVVARLGAVRIVVNNAAVFDDEIYAADQNFGSTPQAVWERTMAVNVIGPALVAKHAATSMVAAGDGGCIINIASTGAFVGDVSGVAYRTSKAALVNLTRCMAASHAVHGIRCNAIAPGLVLSPIALEHSSPERMAMFEQGRLVKDVGLPQDVADLALFLAADESRYITGQTYLIDGGASILQSWHALRESQDRSAAR